MFPKIPLEIFYVSQKMYARSNKQNSQIQI